MRDFEHELEEFLRTTTDWSHNWIDGYHLRVSKDILREFRNHVVRCDNIVMKDIYHTHGEKFAVELFGRERVRKYMNSVEFRNGY